MDIAAGWKFRAARIFFCALFVGVVFHFSAWSVEPLDTDTRTLEVVMMDVGQGDGIFIRTPSGKHILIDAGPDARRGVLPFLRSRHIKKIDALVLTHPHSDHIGGAVSPREAKGHGVKSVLDYCEVREVLDSGKEHTTLEYKNLLESVDRLGIRYSQPRAGDRLKWDPALRVTVLHPDRADYDNINDNSIVIRVEYGKNSFVFTGDAEEAAEEAILSRFGSTLKSDVLKVPHHGSRTSSTPEFLAAIQPRYALISCGYRNTFRHPRPETLEHLQNVDAKILRTDLDGFLDFKTDGRNIRWSRTPIPFPKTDFNPGLPLDFADQGWSGDGNPSNGQVGLDAEPGKNLWINVSDAPRRTRPAPRSPLWSCAVSIAPSATRKTESGLLLFVDENNFVMFGIQEGRLTSLTVVIKGDIAIGPELVAYCPSSIGFRKTIDGLQFMGYDYEKETWRVFWELTGGQIPQLRENARVGVYAKSWGFDRAEAVFKSFKLKDGN